MTKARTFFWLSTTNARTCPFNSIYAGLSLVGFLQDLLEMSALISLVSSLHSPILKFFFFDRILVCPPPVLHRCVRLFKKLANRQRIP